MKVFRITISIILAGFICGLAEHAQAQWVQQQIVLKPGWNAIFLEVDPEPQDCDTLLAGLPIESVWDFSRTTDSAQFVQDPSTLLPGAPGWLTWFPPSHPLAAQANLLILRDGRPYLIKTTNAQPVTWTVIGRPSLRRVSWRAGDVNLVGFHVGAQGPTFQNLFAGESGLAGQPVYSLDATGVWRALADLSTARPQAGEAYWIRCRQPAQRAGTILVESAKGLHFGTGVAELGIRIRNTSAGVRRISVSLLPSAAPPTGQPILAGPVPLEYWRSSYATTNIGWEAVSAPLSLTNLAAGQEWNIRLGARRAGLSSAPPGAIYQGLLRVTDDLGTQWLIPLSADPVGAHSTLAGGVRMAAAGGSTRAGLWVGEAVLQAVSQPAHASNPTVPRPAGGNFTFRLMVHVNAEGTARLLQHVFVLRKPPILGPDPEDPNLSRILEPARSVVVTDEALIPGIIGTAPVVGRRISSPAFGFQQPITLMGGTFGSSTLTNTLTLGYDDPLNPFKHLYHPDHNNLDERFEQTLPEGKEAFTVTRSLSLEFMATDLFGLNPPNWGDTELGGLYRETIRGLHRSSIQVSGNFRLVRVSPAAVLNE